MKNFYATCCQHSLLKRGESLRSYQLSKLLQSNQVKAEIKQDVMGLLTATGRAKNKNATRVFM